MKWYKQQMDKLKKTDGKKSVKQIFDPKNLKGTQIYIPKRLEKRSRNKTDSIS